MTIVVFVLFILFCVGICYPTIRKAVGLLFVITGTLSCLTIVGIVIGVPMIFFGGLLLFMK